jgi:hypothetical protein
MKIRNIRDRSGLEALTEVSAFLGGIFFTSIIFLVQQKEALGIVPFINISQVTFASIPLAFTVVMFVFAAICFAVACNSSNEQMMKRNENLAMQFFLFGFLSMFISLGIVLFIVDLLVGIVGIIFIVGAFSHLMSRI